MNGIMTIDTVQQYNDYFGVETCHPLVSVIEGNKAKQLRFCRKLYNVYAILLKDTNCGNLKYGQSIYDYQQGSMLFLAPGQVMGSEDDGLLHQPEGWALTFHPELLRGTPLMNLIREYSYFSYNANEALHLSEQERQIIIDCMKKISTELQYPIDKHSKSLIIDNVKLLLDYCIRFYDRQFITRENANKDILSRFENLLDEYFSSDISAEKGMLSVQYCADKLCLSANYFSDLCRKETGISALKHIQQKMLDVAKERVFNTSESIGEISYNLGFPYPQHFSRWFRKMTGYTPNEYRQNILN
ncbi:helix-turn-helix domain-containing protein [uncultured Bacteroides sp.]|uniref:helix-turn-helix domain-containing protein n=1 Tax=uncultured Bacteroides sp. TaxID=162156 RepID=UPI0025F2B4C4|nr:helix-turn-helix domain-containing protein [uncultured Bacteroides sp.]